MWRNIVEVQAFATLTIALMIASAGAIQDWFLRDYIGRRTQQVRKMPCSARGVRQYVLFALMCMFAAAAGVVMLVHFKHIPVVLSMALMIACGALVAKIHKWQAVLVVVSTLEVVTVMPDKATPLALMALQAICVELLTELAKYFNETEAAKYVSSILFWSCALVAAATVDTLAVTLWKHGQFASWWRQIPQAYNIGLITPLIGCMFFAAAAWWSGRLNNKMLRVAPQIGALCGVVAGLAMTCLLHWRLGNAGFVGAGAVLSLVIALIVTHEDRCFGAWRTVRRLMS